jgi:glucokinase
MTSALYAGVDLGGTNLSGALADASGAVVAELKEPTLSYEGPVAVLERIAVLVNQLAKRAGRKPAALGIGIPGLVDIGSGTTKFLPNFPTQWRDIPVRAHLEPKIGCPVHILNDARAATLGELVFGRGRTAQTMVFFGLGTGVGGGVVVDGQLHLGPLGAAGELGHQTVLPDGPLCGCGNRGCLETLISGPALTGEGVRLFLAGNAPKLYEICGGEMALVSPITMAKAAEAGEVTVRTAIERAAEWLGIGAANLVVALHPDLIVIGGGVAEMGELLLAPIREAIRRRVGMLPVSGVRVERSELGDKAGLLGGIALALRGGIGVLEKRDRPAPAPRQSL